MEFKFGPELFDDRPDGQQDQLQGSVFENGTDLPQKPLESKTNIYQPMKEGTAFHGAIKSGDQAQIDALVKVYEVDFETVQNYLMTKYQWDTNNKIWFRKSILVAVSEDQCRNAKKLENHQIRGEALTEAVFVLLQIPVNDEEVAVIHPERDKRLEACQLIRSLIPNGFLTWNYTGLDGKYETFIETAAVRGKINVITQLCEHGASLAIPGHNPLISACRSFQMSTVRWLLTERFDSFDCTMRDCSQRSALLVAMQKGDLKMFDLVLEKMISYRKKYYKESESEAFNKLFRYENDMDLCIFSYLGKGPIRERIEGCIVTYELDLFYQWKGFTMLTNLVCRKLALDYCFGGIRKNPELLGLVEYGTTTVLHDLILWGYTDFLREMYTNTPEVKHYFENNSGFYALRTAFWEKNRGKIDFILENHSEFLMNDKQKFKEELICSKHYYASMYVKLSVLLWEYFPQFRNDIEILKSQMLTSQSFQGLEHAYFTDALKIHDIQQPPNSIKGLKGETLLHFAAHKNNSKLFVELLEAGCNFDSVDNEGNHPIHYIRDIEMLNLMIEKHPEGKNLVHRTNSEGCTVLHKVCSLSLEHKALVALVEKIIECGADVNQLTRKGESVVFMIGTYPILDILRKHDVSLDVLNNDGETALQRHLSKKNHYMASILLPLVHELDTFKQYASKCLGLMMNQHRGRGMFGSYYQRFLYQHPETTKLLFDSVYEHSPEEASRLFAKACSSGLSFVVEKFLDFDYDLDYNYSKEYGCIPIIGLLSNLDQRNWQLIKRLLEKNVDLELRNEWGRNALLTILWSLSSAKCDGLGLAAAQLLLDHGAKVNPADGDGNTPLHLAIAKSEWQLVEILVQNKGDLNAKNKGGKIPLEMGSAVDQELFFFMN